MFPPHTRRCRVASHIGKYISFCVVKLVSRPKKSHMMLRVKEESSQFYLQYIAENHKCTSKGFTTTCDTLFRLGKTVHSRKKGRNIKSNRGRITVCKMCFHLRLHLNEMLSNKNLSLPTVVSFAPHTHPVCDNMHPYLE